jgi:hypothetical protein
MHLLLISRFVITIAIFAQLIHVIYVNKQIYVPTFILYAMSNYIMAYCYYEEDNFKITHRILLKLFNSTVLLFIGLLCWKR